MCLQNAPCRPPSRRLSQSRLLALLPKHPAIRHMQLRLRGNRLTSLPAPSAAVGITGLAEEPRSVSIRTRAPAVGNEVTRSVSALMELPHPKHGTPRPPHDRLRACHERWLSRCGIDSVSAWFWLFVPCGDSGWHRTSPVS